MLKRRVTIKDHFQENRLYFNRTIIGMVGIGMIMCILIVRLFFLQIYQHELYKTLSLNNQIRMHPITPARGLILDRNGIIIADNIPIFSLEITPERSENLQVTIENIKKIIPITEAEEQQFYKQLKYKRKSDSIPLRIKLSEEEVAKFSLEKYHFSGVEVVASLIRHYPKGETHAHVLGYIGPISEKDLEQINTAEYRGTYYIGKTNLEKYYEKILHGSSGYQQIETDARGRTIRILGRRAPVSGINLHLTIDSKLQEVAFEALGEFKGAVVALNPNNGEILTLVSKPGFDPNLFAEGVDTQTYQNWQNSPDKPLYNRTILGLYPPGSTIKPIIALKALEKGTVTPQYGIFDPGWFQLHSGGRLYRDWIFHAKKHGHGWVDLEKALTHSCDTYFFNLANRMGISALQDIFLRFGLGQPTGIDLPSEVSGIVPSPEWKKKVRKEEWYAGDTLNVGIGQGMLLSSPLQIAQMAAILATRGVQYRPYLLRGTSYDHQIPEPTTPIPKGTVDSIANEHWDHVLHSMHKVVTEGTAARINNGLKYTIAGKTGTAQVFSLKQNEKYVMSKVKAHLRDHSWFIAFAPVEKPEIALAVLLENKQQKTAADVARVVLDAYFKVPVKAQVIKMEPLQNNLPTAEEESE